jgi:hypothetical protein
MQTVVGFFSQIQYLLVSPTGFRLMRGKRSTAMEIRSAVAGI